MRLDSRIGSLRVHREVFKETEFVEVHHSQPNRLHRYRHTAAGNLSIQNLTFPPLTPIFPIILISSRLPILSSSPAWLGSPTICVSSSTFKFSSSPSPLELSRECLTAEAETLRRTTTGLLSGRHQEPRVAIAVAVAENPPETAVEPVLQTRVLGRTIAEIPATTPLRQEGAL